MFCKKCGSENPDGAKYFAGNAVRLLRREKAVERRGSRLMEETVEPRDSRLMEETVETQGQQTYGGQQTPPPIHNPYPYKMTIDGRSELYVPLECGDILAIVFF